MYYIYIYLYILQGFVVTKMRFTPLVILHPTGNYWEDVIILHRALQCILCVKKETHLLISTIWTCTHISPKPQCGLICLLSSLYFC